MTEPRTRYAIVGTGARAQMFIRAIVQDHSDIAELVAFADTNSARMAVHNRWLRELDHRAVPSYPASEFAVMLDKERVDTVVVTSVDATHDEYTVAAVEAGRAVITEKPMTVSSQGCQRILAATRSKPSQVGVAFNYRYNPVHERVRELIASGVIGEVGSVHFEWLLDVRHGADYFRRWHRDRANSGGLLVHKASHHFDLVNWWIASVPVRVYAEGRLFFYGPGREHGYDRGYDRAHGEAAAADDPFALSLLDNRHLRELYLESEHVDGYLRDRNVFAPGVTIEDDMAVLVRYASGATMSYHLHAYSPWEGYRVMVNGSSGRLELAVVESDHVSAGAARSVKGGSGSAAQHGVDAPVEHGSVRLTIHPFWRPPEEVVLRGLVREGHGGADSRMAARLFGADVEPDPLGRGATAIDGALALLTGLAANESMQTQRPVDISTIIDADLLRLGVS